MGIFALLIVSPGPWWVPTPALLLAACVTIPSAVWWKLRRRDGQGKLIVAIARFEQRSGAGPELGAVHADVLEREIMSRPVLAKELQLRVLKHPLSEAQARRVLRWSAVRAIISGETIAAWDKARWDAWMMTRWPQMEGWTGWDFVGRPFAVLLDVRRTRGERAALGTDADQLISTLSAAEFPADHARGIVATLLELVDSEEAEREAEMMIEHMPAEVRAVRENNRTLDYLERGGDPLEAARRLEDAGDNEADHIWL